MQLGEHFSSDKRGETSEQHQRHLWFIKARKIHEQQEILENRQESNFVAFSESVAIATEIQIQEFELNLDAYDTAIIKALEENEIQLASALAYREMILEQAHILEDGRRVFKSDDGTYLIDENRNVLNSKDYDPDQVPDHLPRESVFITADDDFLLLQQEKQILLEALEQNDESREWANESDRTAEELDERTTRLFDKLPASAKAHLSEEMNPVVNALDITAAFAKTTNPATTVINLTPSQISTYDPMS